MFVHLFEHRRKEMPVNGIDGGDAHMPAPQPAQVIQLLADPVKSFFQLLAACRSSSPAAVSLSPVGWRSKSGIANSVPRAKSDDRWKTPTHAAPLTLYETIPDGPLQ